MRIFRWMMVRMKVAYGAMLANKSVPEFIFVTIRGK